MLLKIFADIILLLHFLIVIYIVSLFLLIPIGFKLNWQIVKNKKIRLSHFFLMLLITFESLIGITCPLTLIENRLRNIDHSENFINYWLSKVIYWDLPSYYFVVIYLFFLFLTTILLFKYPFKN